MNKKAEMFKKFYDKNDAKAFVADELKDESMHTVVFRSGVEIKGQRLPLLAIIDDSIYTMMRVILESHVVTDNNRQAVHTLLNKNNEEFKVFKFYEHKDSKAANGDVILDICLPGTEETFDPAMFDAILRQVVVPYLNDHLLEVMDVF